MVRQISRAIGWLVLLTDKCRFRLWMLIQRKMFRACGSNVFIGPGGSFAYGSIEIGSDVFIGENATFHSAISRVSIGNKVMFGPNVTIMGGDHRIDVVGRYMYDVKEKSPANDLDVNIEDDVWVGAGAIILKGVRLGRGSIVGAGSVVTRSVPPYTIYTGSPSLQLRPRWSAEQIEVHESLLAT